MSESVSLRRLAACALAAALILFVPTGAGFTSAIRFTAFVGLLMALLWMTEAIPLGLTALIPLVAFPVAGIATTERIAAPYANPAVFLFLGGFLISSTFERWNLHRRIAAFALLRVGTEPRRVVFAVILVTAFLSMWMSNTATTLMMTPIVVAIVRGLGATDNGKSAGVGEAALLGVAYAASLGGIGTPIGTPTNLIFLGAARELFPTARTVTFAQWMLFGVAYLVVLVPFCWLMLIALCRVGRGAAVPI
ncbi:MAG TPA: SLC13 family permease, partial [Thermoanaerobaculia bacterium]